MAEDFFKCFGINRVIRYSIFLQLFFHFAFKSSEIKCYLKDFNPHGSLDPNNVIFFLVFNKIAVFLVPKLEKLFLGLIAASKGIPPNWHTKF